MFSKSIMTAAILASTLVFGAAGAAKADPSISFGIGFGTGPIGYGYSDGTYMRHHPWGFADAGWDGGWHPRHEARFGISCGEGAAVARAGGFRGVRPVDCSAPVYRYQGWKFGRAYSIAVNMRGRLLGASPSAW